VIREAPARAAGARSVGSECILYLRKGPSLHRHVYGNKWGSGLCFSPRCPWERHALAEE
jgi:hypothetical protein